MPSSIIEQSDLASAVTLSLFSQGGSYWGDALNTHSLGSKLWILKREALSPQVLRLAEEYTLASLQWLRIQGLANDISVKASQNQDRVVLQITIDGERKGYEL